MLATILADGTVTIVKTVKDLIVLAEETRNA
jgi:hypothetical protein